MSHQKTWLFCVLGFVSFSLGGFARQYMVVRLHGRSGYLSSQRDLTEQYRGLIRSQNAPSWPIAVSFLCLPLGTIIVFGAILLSSQ
jgi:uncharacterized membrane protein (DUF485 family)